MAVYLAAAAVAVAVAGAAVSAAGQYEQTQMQADAERQNARIAQENAERARLHAGLEEADIRRNARALAGRQRASIAESGIELSGTPLDVIEASQEDAELDALTARYNGELEARGLLNERDAARMRAKAAERAGRYAVVGGILGAGSAALGGAANYSRASQPSQTTTPTYGQSHAQRLGY